MTSTSRLGPGTPINSGAKTARNPAAPKPPSPRPGNTQQQRAAAGTELLETVGLVFGIAGMLTNNATLQLDGMTFGLHADTVGPSLAELAEKNSIARALLDRASVLTGVAGIAAVALPLAYQIMANHAPKTKKDPATGAEVPNEIPAQLINMGVLPPDMLLTQYRAMTEAKAARIQADVLRKTRDAQAETERLREEIAGVDA